VHSHDNSLSPLFCLFLSLTFYIVTVQPFAALGKEMLLQRAERLQKEADDLAAKQLLAKHQTADAQIMRAAEVARKTEMMTLRREEEAKQTERKRKFQNRDEFQAGSLIEVGIPEPNCSESEEGGLHWYNARFVAFGRDGAPRVQWGFEETVKASSSGSGGGDPGKNGGGKKGGASGKKGGKAKKCGGGRKGAKGSKAARAEAVVTVSSYSNKVECVRGDDFQRGDWETFGLRFRAQNRDK
jgi:hypothetical protein